MPLLPSFTMAIGDWFHLDGADVVVENTLGHGQTRDLSSLTTPNSDLGYSLDGVQMTTVKYKSGLIEGRGRYNDQSFPLTKYHVRPGTTHR